MEPFVGNEEFNVLVTLNCGQLPPSSRRQMQMEPTKRSGHKGPVYALCALSGNQFLSGSGDGLVVQWDVVNAGSGQVLVNVGQAIFSLYCDQASELLFIGTEGGKLHVIDLVTRKEQHCFTVHQKGIFRIVKLSKGSVISAGGDGSLSLWTIDAEDRSVKFHRQIPVIEAKLRDLAISADQKQLAVACGDGTIRIFVTDTFNEIHTLDGHLGDPAQPGTQGTSSVSFHPTKPALMSGGKDGYIRSWKLGEHINQISAIPAHKGAIYAIAPGGTTSLTATCSRDKTIKTWDLATFDLEARIDRVRGGHSHSVNALLWLQDRLISASDDRTVMIWDPADLVKY